MSSWVRVGLKEDKELLKHLKPLGDKHTPSAPEKSANNSRSSTEQAAGVAHLKGNVIDD